MWTWLKRHYYDITDAFWHSARGKWLCERGGHAPGVWWYSSGWEPDMHCKRCDKDLS